MTTFLPSFARLFGVSFIGFFSFDPAERGERAVAVVCEAEPPGAQCTLDRDVRMQRRRIAEPLSPIPVAGGILARSFITPAFEETELQQHTGRDAVSESEAGREKCYCRGISST